MPYMDGTGYICFIYLSIVDIYYINWWMVGFTHRRFQGKAPPPPVAKGAGKVAFFGWECWRIHGFCFVITEFFVWEKNYYSWDWLMFVFLIFGVIISLKVVSVNSCGFFVCFLRMNCFTEPMKPRNESSFETKRIDRWYINSICLYCNREWFGGISLLYHRCDEIFFVSWVPGPFVIYTVFTFHGERRTWHTPCFLFSKGSWSRLR